MSDFEVKPEFLPMIVQTMLEVKVKAQSIINALEGILPMTSQMANTQVEPDGSVKSPLDHLTEMVTHLERVKLLADKYYQRNAKGAFGS